MLRNPKGAVVKVPRSVLAGLMSAGLWIAPIAGEAQPALEHFRFDPSRLCLRDVFQWGFSNRGFPGGLAAVKDLEVRGLLEGKNLGLLALDPVERRPSALHRRPGKVREPPPALAEEGAGGRDRVPVHAASRACRPDMRSRAKTSVRYVDSCPPPPAYPTLAAGPTGRIGLQTSTPTISEFLQGVRPAAANLIWGDLELPRGQVERSPAVVLVHGSRGVSPPRGPGGRRSSVRRARRRSSSIASRAALLPAPRRTSRRSAAWP